MRSEAQGFTLIETIVAFTLLAVVLSAAYGAMSAGGLGAAAGAERMAAMARAEALISGFDAAPWTGPDHRAKQDGAWTETLTAEAVEQSPALLRLEAEIAWRDGAQTRHITLTTLRPAGRP